MDANDLVKVYTVTDPAQAEIIKGALESEGIPCELGGEGQGKGRQSCHSVNIAIVRVLFREGALLRSRDSAGPSPSHVDSLNSTEKKSPAVLPSDYRVNATFSTP